MHANIANWADNTPLIDAEEYEKNMDNAPIKNLTSPIAVAKKNPGKRLDAYALRDPIAFNDLYYTWLGFSAIYWRQIETRIQAIGSDAEMRLDDDYKYYTGENVTEQECEDYLNNQLKKTFKKLSSDLQGFIDTRDAIRKQMQGIPFYMQLRVIAACLLTYRKPDMLFSQGGNWIDVFSDLMPHREDDLKVEDGMTLQMDFASPLPEGSWLWPRSLYNDSDQTIALNIRWNRKDYIVHLPPNGRLRALFADEHCERLLGLKGNIAFNADGGTATVQLYDREKPNATIIAVVSGGEAYTAEFKDVLDVFPLRTAFGVLRAHDIRDNNGRILEEMMENGELPVRLYAVGNCWARLYGDGTLIYGDTRGKRDSVAVTCVADDGAAICFYTRDGKCCSWSRGTLITIGVGRQDFLFERMMSRFLKQDRCESATGSRVTIETDLQGRL